MAGWANNVPLLSEDTPQLLNCCPVLGWLNSQPQIHAVNGVSDVPPRPVIVSVVSRPSIPGLLSLQDLCLIITAAW
jgi:hypothetical protein